MKAIQFDVEEREEEIDEEGFIQQSKRLAEMKVNKINNQKGNLKNYDCDKCLNRGFMAKATIVKRDEEEKINYWDVEIYNCTCKKEREVKQFCIDSGLGKYLEYTSKDFITNEEWQKTLIDKASDFVKKHSDDNTWFCLLGQSGSGKTMICSIICKTLIQKHLKHVRYIIWTDFISRIKRLACGTDEDKEKCTELLDLIKNVDVLFIDELIKRYNDTDLRYLNEIINYRYNNQLKTLMTSERNMNELIRLDSATFSRFIEMSENGNYIVEINNDSKRNQRLKGVQKIQKI